MLLLGASQSSRHTLCLKAPAPLLYVYYPAVKQCVANAPVARMSYAHTRLQDHIIPPTSRSFFRYTIIMSRQISQSSFTESNTT